MERRFRSDVPFAIQPDLFASISSFASSASSAKVQKFLLRGLIGTLIAGATFLLALPTANADMTDQADHDTAAQTPIESLKTSLTPPGASRPKHLYALLFSRTDVAASSVHDSDPDAYTVNRTGLRYRFTDDRSLSVMQEFLYVFAKSDRGTSTQMRDLYFQFNNDNLFMLPGEWSVSGRMKFYLPTGEVSAAIRREGEVIAEVFATKNIHRLELEAQTLLYLYNQTQDNYQRGKHFVATDSHEIDNYFAATYHLSSKFNVFHSIGLEMNFQHALPNATATRTTSLSNETGVSYKMNRQLRFTLSLANDPAFDPANSANVYNDIDTIYRAVVEIRI